MKRFPETCCYFVQNQKRKESTSISNFDGQLQNILFTCIYPCIRIPRVFMWSNCNGSARGVYYFLV